MNIKRVIVRGYNGHGFGSGFIRRFTFGNYSHVSLVFEWKDGMREEIEAIQGDGVIKHAPWKEGEKDFDELVATLTLEQALDLFDVVSGLIGSSYDWKGIWGMFRRKNKHNPDKWFCSELVAYGLYKAGYPLSRREPYRETPTSVMESFRLVEK